MQVYHKKMLIYVNEQIDQRFNANQIGQLFSGQHQKFNIINFFLLNKYIQSNEDCNLQILIPDKYYKQDLLSTLLLSLSIIKYQQNINNLQDNIRYDEPNKKDVYYIGNRFCQVQRITDKECILTYVNQSKAERENQIEIPKSKDELKIIHKLRKQFSYNRNTLKCLQEYIEFYKTHIDNYRFLTSFQRKTVIVSSSKVLSQNQKMFLPFVYQGEKADSIPITPLIQVFNKYEEARSYLKKNNDIDEVIVIGYAKYQNLFGEILNDRNSGLFKKLILIGSKKVKDSSFKFWQWTRKEINFLSENRKWCGSLNRKLVSDKSFEIFRKDLLEFQNRISFLGVDPNEIEAVNSFFITLFSQQLDSNNLDQLSNYIQSLFEEENDFDEAISILSEGEQVQYRKQYLALINDFLKVFKNRKIEILKQLRFDKQHNIISPRKNQVESLNEHLKSGSNRKSKVITNKELESIIKIDNIINPNKTVFVVPHVRFHYDRPLWYYHLYNKALEFGEVQFICYKGVDELRLDLFESLYKKQEQYRITHPDRCWFVNIEYEVEKPLEKEEEELIENLDIVNVSEDLNVKDIKQIKRYFKTQFKILESLNTPKVKVNNKPVFTLSERKNKVFYLFTFKNNDTKKVGEYDLYPKQVAIQKYELIEGCELEISDRIIGDWKLVLKDVLLMLKGLTGFRKDIKEIELAGAIWQEWLSSLYRYYRNRESFDDKALSALYQRLDLSVSKSTLKKWINTKDKLFFPRANQDLENIFILREKVSLNKQFVREQKTKLTKGSTSLLYKIKRELSIYNCTKEKGEVISKIKETDLDKLIKTRKIKQIQKIENYDR